MHFFSFAALSWELVLLFIAAVHVLRHRPRISASVELALHFLCWFVPGVVGGSFGLFCMGHGGQTGAERRAMLANRWVGEGGRGSSCRSCLFFFLLTPPSPLH